MCCDITVESNIVGTASFFSFNLSENPALNCALFVKQGFPVAQMVEHGASNAKIMGSIPRESKSW